MGLTFDTSYVNIKAELEREFKTGVMTASEAKATLEKARNYRVKYAVEAIHELRRIAYGDSFKRDMGIMGRDRIAAHLGLSDNEADELISDWLYFGITERQGGGVVV